jgi:wyosine [tRNA(Phe)-imidazoG37] synthetase (radical SAM superfamily)
MSIKSFQYSQGLTSSQLFGRALEFEIVPPHSCPFNCIHCGHGKTMDCAIEPVEYFFPQGLIDDQRKASQREYQLDHIVLSGKGEPLLFSGIHLLIDELRRVYRVPVAVASCGTLLWNEQVRREILGADIVLASLDASDATTFNCVNRPHGRISYPRFVQGLLDFSKSFKGDLWLQVHLLDGITAIKADVLKIASVVDRINPKRVFIRTTRQSPPEKFAFPVENERLYYFKQFFGDKVTVIERDTINILR